MKTHIWLFTLFVLSQFVFAGCGPSEAEIATMTAAAWTPTPTITPTPTPTATPTPVPYNLTLLVLGEGENPISGALITLLFMDVGDQTTDDSGTVTWTNLPNAWINLTVTAQGYFPSALQEGTKRGDNHLTIKLERDPYGILPSEACASGERLLYIDDFQDSMAQGWPEIENRKNDWNIVSDPDNPGDIVITRPAAYEGQAWFSDVNFDNAVWRFKIMQTGKSISNFSWRWHGPYESEPGFVDWSAYTIWTHAQTFFVNRDVSPLSNMGLGWPQNVMKVGVWHQFEISTYEGRFEFWMDGILQVRYDDPNPLPEGGLAIGVGMGNTPENTADVYFDDFVVCELTAPFTPMPTPEP